MKSWMTLREKLTIFEPVKITSWTGDGVTSEIRDELGKKKDLGSGGMRMKHSSDLPPQNIQILRGLTSSPTYLKTEELGVKPSKKKEDIYCNTVLKETLVEGFGAGSVGDRITNFEEIFKFGSEAYESPHKKPRLDWPF